MTETSTPSSSLANVKIPRPEEIFDTMTSVKQAIAKRREQFMATKAESVAKTIIEELVTKIQGASYEQVSPYLRCDVDVAGMCGNDKVLTEKVFNDLVRLPMEEAGWYVSLSSLAVGVYVSIAKEEAKG